MPDLEDARPTEDVLFTAPCGPVTGLDLMYGLRWMLPTHPYMAHHTGFTQATLTKALSDAGFKAVVQRMEHFNLMAIAVK